MLAWPGASPNPTGRTVTFFSPLTETFSSSRLRLISSGSKEYTWAASAGEVQGQQSVERSYVIDHFTGEILVAPVEDFLGFRRRYGEPGHAAFPAHPSQQTAADSIDGPVEECAADPGDRLVLQSVVLDGLCGRHVCTQARLSKWRSTSRAVPVDYRMVEPSLRLLAPARVITASYCEKGTCGWLRRTPKVLGELTCALTIDYPANIELGKFRPARPRRIECPPQ